MPPLHASVEPDELASLGQRFPSFAHTHHKLSVDSPFLDGPDQLLTSRGRRAEICYILHRGDPAQGLLLHRKVMYPAGAFRLPTGGIQQGERVLETLAREIEEETSFQIEKGPNPVRIEAFLGVLSYELWHASQQRLHTFATYHFLVSAPQGAEPVTLDPAEKIAGWQWRPQAHLSAIADRLESLTAEDPVWFHWGRFRALSHRFVAARLAG